VIGLKLADEPEVISALDSRKHAGCKRAKGILTDAELELSVGAPFANPRRFDDVCVDQERRDRMTLTKRPESLQVLDGGNAERPAKRDVDLRQRLFAEALALGGLQERSAEGIEGTLRQGEPGRGAMASPGAQFRCALGEKSAVVRALP
jgi:hypothetical protein